jgi:hypothetical protein
METITLKEYAEKVGCNFEPKTLAEIQEFAQDELDYTIWDYPVEEYNYALNEVHDGNADELVFVETEFGIRVCEL